MSHTNWVWKSQATEEDWAACERGECQIVDDDTIRVIVEPNNVLTRWPCVVCGGHTDKTDWLAIGLMPGAEPAPPRVEIPPSRTTSGLSARTA
jgi:hypothetical protein